MHMAVKRSFWTALPDWRKVGRRRRLPKDTGCSATCVFELLEARTLLSIDSIPMVPTPEAHWTFDEGVDITAVDSSGNGHTGTLGAGVSWTDGNVGSHAISLTGTASGVVTADGPVVDTSESFTVSAWVELASLSGYQTVVSIAGDTVAGFFLQLREDTGTLSFARLPSDANGIATFVAASTAPEIGTWYHIVGVNDATAGTITMYLDGRSMGSAAYSSGWEATGNTLIGHGLYNGDQVDFVNGSIDEVQLFSTALSAEQVAALDQPAAYSFDDGEGTTAADVSGHSNTLALGAGASWAVGHLGSNSLAVNGSASGNATNASPVINTALPFSVSAWVKLNSLNGFQTFVSIDGTATSAFYLQLRGDTGRFAFTRLASDSNTATAYHADATSTPSTGVWYNLLGVNDVANSQLLLYVDGELESTVSYSGGWQGTGATIIGGGKFNGARADYVDGEIDDVRFYNSPLSDSVAMLIGNSGSTTVSIAMGSTGVAVSPDLFGAFMEDINYGGEGGIYSNEVRNSGFNDSTSPLNAWAAVAGAGVVAALSSDTTTGPTSALAQSGKLSVISGVSASARVGISNSGYFGVAVAPSTTYTVDFYAKSTPGFTGPLTVAIESNSGTIYASASVPSITSAWTKYSVTLTTGAGAPVSSNNRLVISTNSASANGATLWFGAAYLYPPGYNGGDNHFRSDLMQWLVDLQPAIWRVPGGNYLEGNTFEDRFNWFETIGPVEDRPGHLNSAWGYWSTDGIGLDEYLEMAELMGAEPVLAVYAGYTLDGSSDTGATLANDVIDAINELHYVLDPVTTPWGALRAANGHPEPYDVNYVEIGNEDWFSTTYPVRYPLFYDAIRAEFPSLKIIATSTSTGGRPFDVLDDHFYNSPQWFLANSDYYDDVPRGSYEILVGEYAAREGAPTSTMAAALGDAAWLMGLMRNSDLVTMSAYAPLWVNVDSYQWSTDLIGFNNTSSFGSASYYAQLILSQNHGATVVSDTMSGPGGLQTIVTRSDSTYYLTVVNPLAAPSETTVNLLGAEDISPTGTVTTLSASASNAVNSIFNPINIVPVTSDVSGLDASFIYTFPGYSLTVLEFTATIDTPMVATPAAASPALVTGTTTDLSVLGADSTGESNLEYTWSATGPGQVIYSNNGTNAAKNTTATFTEAGTYQFTANIVNSIGGASTTSSVTVTVEQVTSGVGILPANPTVAAGATMQLTAAVVDQFGNPMPIEQPSFTWSVTSGAGSVNASGMYTAPMNAGAATVHAVSESGSAEADVAIIAPLTWYKADTNSGNNLVDSSGSGNTGTLAGSTGWEPGVSGNALSLNGGSASLPAGIVSGLGDFTISTWVNIDTLRTWSRVFDFGTGTTANMFLTTRAVGVGGPVRFAITTSGNGGEQQLSGPTLSADTWYHLAVTLAGNTGTLYVNGAAVATNTSMTMDPADLGNTTQNYLGNSQYPSDPSLLGMIDDFRIYGVALSAEQIQQLASPFVVAPAAASANPVTTTSTTLSVLAADLTAGESALIYTWSVAGSPPAPVMFSANGTNAAKNTVATFTQPGVYDFVVTIVNPAAGLSTSSTSTVTVGQVLPGDYNQNGEVEAGDYIVWRMTKGQAVTPYAGADASGNGIIDQTDYNYWRENFGMILPESGAASGAGAVAARVVPDTSQVEAATIVAEVSEVSTASQETTVDAQRVDRQRGALVGLATRTVPDALQRVGRHASVRRLHDSDANHTDQALAAWVVSRTRADVNREISALPSIDNGFHTPRARQNFVELSDLVLANWTAN